MAGDALLDVPERVRDGSHVLFVDDVFADGSGEGFTRTAEVSFHPPEPGTGPVHETLLPVSMLGPDVAPGAAYRVEVAGSDLTDVVSDPEAAIERAAATVPESQFLVPLVWTDEWAGDVAVAPHLLPFARNHSLLLTGEPGAGKTEFVKLLLPQIRANPEEPLVVFDFKGEYGEWASERGDVVRLSSRGSTHYWNLFEEVADERELEQLGKSLFRDRERRATKPFFPVAARQVLVAVLKYLAREGAASGLRPDNRELVDFLDRFGSEEVYELVTAEREDGPTHEDLHGAMQNLTPNSPRQTGGVYATLQSVVGDVFTGDFARPDGRFSVREYMADPRGRVLLLDYPITEGDRVEPAFRYLVERAIGQALADGSRHAYFVLDEFARIPQVDGIERLVATGRARRTQAILGLQSLSQLTAAYGRLEAESMLSGTTQEVFLRSGDPATTEYVTGRLGGERRQTDSFRAGERGSGRRTTVSGPSMRGRLQRFAPGEGFLLTRGGYVHAQVPMWSQLRERTRRAIRERTSPWGEPPADRRG
jgi:hypothetical protein